ncbi:MAG: hypothetical protein ACT4PW_03425 [Acidimicrobiia bacterium]
MDAADTAAAVVACASVVALAVMVWAAASLTSAVKVLRESVEQLQRETLPVVADLRATVGHANAELERVDTLIGAAESVTATVEGASRLAYNAFANPVIKAFAFASGSGRAARRLRRRRQAR